MRKFLDKIFVVTFLCSTPISHSADEPSCCGSACFVTTASLFSLSRIASPFVAGFSHLSHPLTTASLALNTINVISSVAEQIIPCLCPSGFTCGTNSLAPLACMAALGVSAAQWVHYGVEHQETNSSAFTNITSDTMGVHDPLYMANVALSTIALGITVLRYRYLSRPGIKQYSTGLVLCFPLEGYQDSDLANIPIKLFLRCTTDETRKLS